ncbi:hypothetical protein NE237_022309 [Protea cynaroides]|uniref:Uncharacterized protein n=1 Tax=Protea cynaroides TaxID=273540 RepID=A0A9Q0HAP7_9MAGN|nr:hypothetical protein NE237_022309 [Protea cynaroides]
MPKVNIMATLSSVGDKEVVPEPLSGMLLLRDGFSFGTMDIFLVVRIPNIDDRNTVSLSAKVSRVSRLVRVDDGLAIRSQKEDVVEGLQRSEARMLLQHSLEQKGRELQVLKKSTYAMQSGRASEAIGVSDLISTEVRDDCEAVGRALSDHHVLDSHRKLSDTGIDLNMIGIGHQSRSGMSAVHVVAPAVESGLQVDNSVGGSVMLCKNGSVDLGCFLGFPTIESVAASQKNTSIDQYAAQLAAPIASKDDHVGFGHYILNKLAMQGLGNRRYKKKRRWTATKIGKSTVDHTDRVMNSVGSLNLEE